VLMTAAWRAAAPGRTGADINKLLQPADVPRAVFLLCKCQSEKDRLHRCCAARGLRLATLCSSWVDAL
jgi:hypothetical protein